MKTKRTFLRAVLYLLVCASIVFTLSICVYADSNSFIDSPEEISAAADSVVMLYCYDKSGELIASGSGFAAITDGLIVTNYHVIEDGVYSVRAETEGKLSFEIEDLLAYDEQNDIAILKTSARTGLRLLPLGSNADLLKGSKVVAIGSPEGYRNIVSSGLYSGISEIEERELIRFDAPITHGSSGGALFNNSGEVIGITCGSVGDGFLLNLAVPIEKVMDLYSHASMQNAIKLKDFYTESEDEDFFDDILFFDVSDLDKSAYDGVWVRIGDAFEMYIPSDWISYDPGDLLCALSSQDGVQWLEAAYFSPSEAETIDLSDNSSSEYIAFINDIMAVIYIDADQDINIMFYDENDGLYWIYIYSLSDGGALYDMPVADSFLCSLRNCTTASKDLNTLLQFRGVGNNSVSVGDIITLGAYEQDNNTANGKEPIEWQILNIESDKALLISCSGLDVKLYDDDEGFSDMTWADCSLREWLNSDFYDSAFVNHEKKLILTTEVSDEKNPLYGTDPGRSTEDKFFLLSISEAEKYLDSPEARICKPTPYAISNGAVTSEKKAGFWWLRSPGDRPNRAAYIQNAGSINYIGCTVNTNLLCVRPALWIDLDS